MLQHFKLHFNALLRFYGLNTTLQSSTTLQPFLQHIAMCIGAVIVQQFKLLDWTFASTQSRVYHKLYVWYCLPYTISIYPILLLSTQNCYCSGIQCNVLDWTFVNATTPQASLHHSCAVIVQRFEIFYQVHSLEKIVLFSYNTLIHEWIEHSLCTLFASLRLHYVV